ncbi:hypothetical protein Barb4_04702 [Bacteroidales bacterium Barb4]|nr:hypothetical protein Barb4_04702 [Bacteroidales bacterium Barb4]
METVQHGNVSSGYIGYYFGNEEGTVTRPAFFVVRHCFFLKGFDTPNAGTEDNTDAIQVFFFHVKTGVGYGLFGCCQRKEAVAVAFPGFFPVHLLQRVEILDLAGKTGFELGRVKLSDRPRTASPVNKTLPCFMEGLT